MTQGNHPSYVTCVADVLSTSSVPLSMDTLVTRVEARRPVGKSVRSSIYQAIGKLYQAIQVAPGHYGWLSRLLDGQYFRHPLNSIEIRKGYLLLDELEHAVFFPEFFQAHQDDERRVQVELMAGPTLMAGARVEQGTWALQLGGPFVDWVEQVGGNTHDDLLIWANHADSGSYGIRLQPREARQNEQIERRNHLLVQMAEEVVLADRKVRPAVPVWELAAALIGRGVFQDPVPPDDMHYVLHEYSRLRLYDEMGYAMESQIPSPRTSRMGSGRSESYTNQPEAPPWHYSEVAGSSHSDEHVGNPIENDLFDFDGEIDEELESMIWGLLGESFEEDSDSASDHCEGYQTYLAELHGSSPNQMPLTHMEFHLLEAELEMLISLEQEFGNLMPEQESRKEELASRLFVDLDYFYDDEDWDRPDYDDPPYWQN